MKRSHSTAELPVLRPLVPATSDDPESPTEPAPDEPAPALFAEPNAVEQAQMAFPGPYTYVPRPAAMQDSITEPGSESSASGGQDGLGEGANTPTFPGSNRSQPHSEPVPAAGGSATAAASTGIAHPAVDDDNPDGLPPLILAAFKGRPAEVKLLLNNPALDINQVHQKSGWTALIAASYANNSEMVACLLAAGAKVNLACGQERCTALTVASVHGHVEVVKTLVTCKDIALDETDANGLSALFLAALKNKPGVVACLVAAGAKVNLVDGQKRCTALMVASVHGHAEVVKTLVTCKDIALDETDVGGYSALFLAVLKNAPDVVACLLAAGAKVNLVCGEERQTALMGAAHMGHVEIVNTLLRRKDIGLDETDAGGYSALFLAVLKNAPDVVACLLAAGAKVNLVCGEERRTALMEAAFLGYVEDVKTLLTRKDIALDETDGYGRSALFLAALKNAPDVVACLLAAGASVTVANAHGKTATAVAIVKKHAAVLEVLVQHGAALPSLQHVGLAQLPSAVAFAVTLADLDADRKSPADPQDNPLGLAAPHSLNDPLAIIDELLAVLESKQDLQQWLRAKGIRMACALPVVECLASLAGSWPVLANGARAATVVQKRLVCAAALSRLSVLTAEGKALAYYKVARISAAGVERLSALATRQIEKLIAVSEQLLTTMGSAMFENLVPDCLAGTSLARQVDAESLVANLVRAGWLTPLAQAIVTSWKSALTTLEAEPLAIAAGSTMQQITQCVFDNTERKAPQIFVQAMQRALAASALLAALRTWIGDAKSAEGLDLLFQVQCDQLRQYCQQIASAG